MKRYLSPFIIIPSLLLGVCFSSCHQNATKEQKAMAKAAALDTTQFLKVANFVSEKEREKIISEERLLPNGKKRVKGLKPVPQDNDDFRRAMLDGVYWNGVHSGNSDFRGVSMRSAKCNETNFNHSDFRVADVRWTLFDRSILYGCNFAQAKLFHDHVTDSRLDSSDFRGANMFGMTGHRASLKYCDFTNALMKDVEFTHADFSYSKAVHTRFIRAVLTGSRFDNCNLSESDFSGAGLEGASFKNAKLINVKFNGAHLQEADFTGADLKGCYFFGAEMAGTNFTNSKNIPYVIKKHLVNGKMTGVVLER